MADEETASCSMVVPRTSVKVGDLVWAKSQTWEGAQFAVITRVYEEARFRAHALCRLLLLDGREARAYRDHLFAACWTFHGPLVVNQP